jgi:hypothetical protein
MHACGSEKFNKINENFAQRAPPKGGRRLGDI